MITCLSMNSFIWMMALMISLSKNPVKISMTLLGLSSGIFLSMGVSGSVWFALLFFLIFMGGILMMFMILSSIFPNEKEKSSKISKKLVLIILILSLVLMSNEWFNSTEVSNLKAFLQSSLSFGFLMILMINYFFLSIKMVSMEESSLRSVFCYK